MLSNNRNAKNPNTVNHTAQFYQSALLHNLPQAAILLWLSLYLRMQAQGTFADLRIATADLMDELGISRSGLQRARQRLVDAGLLHMEQKAHQALHYTLCLNDTPLVAQPMQNDAAIITTAPKSNCQSRAASKPAKSEQAKQRTTSNANLAAAHANASISPAITQEGKQTTAHRSASDVQKMTFPTDKASFAEVILSDKYFAALDAFHQRYPDVMLHGSLRNWAEQRQKNGWALTAWGLQVLLDKLVQLADGDVKTMTAIVAQSIQKRWKGFHKLKIEARPSGQALRKLEEKEERAEMRQYRTTGNHMPVYKSCYKQDLSALVI